MTKFNAVIVGGGLGGLTAGATLAKLGKKVLLLEQHYIPGGCATTFKRKDFIFEVGLHEMDGLYEKDSKLRIFELLGVNKSVEFKQVPELFHVKYDSMDFTFPHGREKALHTLTDKFPEEKKGIKALFKLMNGVLEEIPKMPSKKWKSTLLLPLMPLLFPNIVKASRSSVGHWLDKNIKNDQLKLILTTNLLYYGDDPYTMSLMYFSTAQASYIGGGGHFIKGGSQKLSDYLTRFIQSHGGQVLLGKKVENVIIEKGKACGVKFKDAFNEDIEPVSVYSDSVILNAAIPLAAKMLPEPYQSILNDKTSKYEEACSLISVYMGFDVDLKTFGIKHYSSYIQGEEVHSLKDIRGNYQGEWDNKSFVFVDYSQIDSELAPEGKSVGVICAADYLKEWENLNPVDYKNKKDQVAQLFFQRLEKHYPGIMDHLVYYEVGTSKTIQKFTLNPKGTPYGYAQTPAQSGMGRIPSKSSVKNMYFASAWSFPGGGFTGAILGGFLCARTVNIKLKRPVTEVALLKDSRIVKLLHKQIIAENTIELTFEKPKGFHHLPGQYAILKLNNPKYNTLELPFRSLSIVSHPEESGLRFAMRLSESGFKQSCNEMKPGDEATVFGPTGQFTLPEKPKNIAFLIAGIGITPVIPMLRELEKKCFKGKVILFYSNKILNTTSYHDKLNSLYLDKYTYVPVTTNNSKRIDGELIKSHIKNLIDFDYYLVGTSPFLKEMKHLLMSEGVDLAKINEDDFGL
jgi:all-trans-retinol 13,14-reductase